MSGDAGTCRPRRARAGSLRRERLERTHGHGEAERVGEVLPVELADGLRVDAVIRPEPAQEPSAERVAGSDGVDDVDGRRLQLGAVGGCLREGAIGATRQHRESHSALEQRVGDGLEGLIRVEPLRVGLAELCLEIAAPSAGASSTGRASRT